MPWFAAAAPVIGAVAGGVLASRASGKASSIQGRSADEALKFEREREATRQAEFADQQRALKEQWDAYQSMRAPFRSAAASLLRRQGFSAPTANTTMPSGGLNATAANMGTKPLTGTLAALAGFEPSTPALQAPRTLGDWSNWQNYGVR